MSECGISTGKTLFDLAKAFDISVPDARHLVRSGPGCFVGDGNMIYLPPIYERAELTAFIRGSGINGGTLLFVVYGWLGHTVEVPEF